MPERGCEWALGLLRLGAMLPAALAGCEAFLRRDFARIGLLAFCSGELSSEFCILPSSRHSRVASVSVSFSAHRSDRRTDIASPIVAHLL